MELTRQEEAALAGEQGEAMQTAYRVLLATGEATGAERLAPVSWAHVSGVNYNTIGDAGEQFLADLSRDARVRIRTTLNPMGYDVDSVERYGLSENFVRKQESIRGSYESMGVDTSFSCIPYEIYDLPGPGTRVSFAESNAAIYANSVAGLRTNKESAFSALASALTGKSPYTSPPRASVAVRMMVDSPNEMEFGMLGFFAGKIADGAVTISGAGDIDRRSCKSLCGGLGTSGTCSRFDLAEPDPDTERVDFGREELQCVRDELDTSESGDVITLGSPQLGFEEMRDLSGMLGGKSFAKRCMVFCPRSVQDQARSLGYAAELERAGCEVLSDCCTCLTPLLDRDTVDSVTTNSIKGAYYLKNSNRLGVNLKPLSEIIRDETR